MSFVPRSLICFKSIFQGHFTYTKFSILPLATTLLTLNLFAFLLHTIAQLADLTYQQVRHALGKRLAFFEDVRALMRYLLFDNWHHLLNFMFVQLELVPD